MATTLIREIRNNSGLVAQVCNREAPGDTADGRGDFQPGESRKFLDVEFAIPWCDEGQAPDFDQRHISILLDGRPTFAIWQASHDGLDRVRVCPDFTWHKPGEVIGGIAAVGPLEEFVLKLRERTLVINDASLWLLPFFLTETLDNMARHAREDGYKVCGVPVDRPIASVPKTSVISFSMAGPASDWFDAKRPGARFQYRDSGKRYEFRITNGTVTLQPAVLGRSMLDRAVSYQHTRVAEESAAPPFDLIAASSGGRVFAKERGWDRFYFAIVDEGYIHAGKDGGEFIVPISCFKLDPEFNQATAHPAHLANHLESASVPDVFGGHPAAERWPLYRLLLGYGLIEVMVLRMDPDKRFKWHRLDTRPPVMNQMAQFARSMDDNFPFRNEILPWLGPGSAMVQHNPPPSWVPVYNHVRYCPNAPLAAVWQQSIDYRRVLDIGVGHIHHHEQYESLTGGEIQPFFMGKDHPNWWLDAADQYRFLYGPIRDGDNYSDGTCNYYALVQLGDDTRITAAETDLVARRNAYALLWVDEQAFFTQRWHLAHPDDWRGAMISIVERLQTDPERYNRWGGWDLQRYWCPFRTGHIGPRSRMAVSAQVIIVTGEDPRSGTPLLCSTNFSFCTMDRSWRWRSLPAPARYFDGQTLWTPPVVTLTGDERVLDGPDYCVYPQTIRLREDMTICMQGRGPGRDGRPEVGWWYQRYLPATYELMPPATELRPGQEPERCGQVRADIDRYHKQIADYEKHITEYDAEITELPRRDGQLTRESLARLAEIKREIAAIQAQITTLRTQITTLEREAACIGCRPHTPGDPPLTGYAHPWKFLPEEVFRLADQFSHFGVYDVVDSRMQYYLVTPASPADDAVLAQGEAGAWIDDRGQIAADAYSFRFDWMRLWWPISNPDFLKEMFVRWLLQCLGMDAALTPAVVRPPHELKKMPPSLFNPDTRLRIVRRGRQWIAMHWDKRDDDLMPFMEPMEHVTLTLHKGPDLQERSGSAVVTLQGNPRQTDPRLGHGWVGEPPVAPVAYFGWERPDPSGPVHAVVGFVTPRSQEPLNNVWRVRIAALDPARPGQSVPLLDVTTPSNFTATLRHAFEHRRMLSSDEEARVRKYCSPAGAIEYGTSIWFEDIVGHVSVPERIDWQAPRAAFVRQSTLPSLVVVGQRVSGWVTMRNIGDVPWTAAARFGLRTHNPQESLIWGVRHLAVPETVVPGAEVTFTFAVTAPASPGSYPLQWQMVQEGEEWFGALTPPVLVTVTPLPLQPDWRWCHKCGGLFWAGGGTAAGRCATGGAHERGASSDYALVMEAADAPGQSDWRWCHKCGGLFWAGGGTAAGCCAAEGAHERGASAAYALVMDVADAPGQHDWRWCHKCGGLFWAGGRVTAGICAAGGTHERGASSDYALVVHTTTTVPDLREMTSAMAARTIRAADLVPRFTEAPGSGGWVAHQWPSAGTVVARGTTVTCQLSTGPIR